MDKAYLILTNGHVLTLDADNTVAEAVAVGRDGRILAVDRAIEVDALADGATKVVNLRGRTLIPGFFDCHMHLLWLGDNLGHVNVGSEAIREPRQILDLLRQRLAGGTTRACLQANGYDQNRLPGGNHLTRHDLDTVSTDIPIYVGHTSGHAAVVNTTALRLLGITRETSDPSGGEIGRDTTGEPDGLLLETASWNNLERLVPKMTAAEAVDALGRASKALLAQGITSATDANTVLDSIDWYAQAVSARRLQVRTNCMVDWPEVVRHSGENTVPSPDSMQPQRMGVDGHRLYIGQAKLFADGAITTRTCLLSQPFNNMPGNYGIAMHEPDALRDLILRAHRSGWQIATHAIGDKAIDLVLSAYADAQRQFSRHRPDHRIEHCMLLDSQMIARMRRQNVWSIGQPEFISRLGDAYWQALGEERANRLSPYATLDAQNVAQAFSSDCPVVPGAPLDGIRAAMTRRTPSGRVLNQAECLPVETALYAYTAAPAYASRVERDRGTIEPGKWADFAVLSADPLSAAEDDWEAIHVAATFVGGDCLYDSGALSG